MKKLFFVFVIAATFAACNSSTETSATDSKPASTEVTPNTTVTTPPSTDAAPTTTSVTPASTDAAPASATK